MKHLELYEDFGSFDNPKMDEPNLIVTSYDMDDAEGLVDKASEFGFTSLESINVAKNYLRLGKIWAIEVGPDLYFYQPSVDPKNPITSPTNKRMPLGDFCDVVGCSEDDFLTRVSEE